MNRIVSTFDQAVTNLRLSTVITLEQRVAARWQAMGAAMTPTWHRVVTQWLLATLDDSTETVVDNREISSTELNDDELIAMQQQANADAQAAAEKAAAVAQEQVSVNVFGTVQGGQQ